MVSTFTEDSGQKLGLSCLWRTLWPCGFALRTRGALDDCGIVLSESVQTGSQGDFTVSCDQVYLMQSIVGFGKNGLVGR